MTNQKKVHTFAFPSVVLIDSSEQAPYRFKGFKADTVDGCQPPGAPLIIPTRRVSLPTGDYSLDGLSDQVTIERKSLSDLYSTLASGRGRFRAEMERMRSFKFAAVVIEATFGEILTDPPRYTNYSPRSVMRTIYSWMQRYGVHFVPCDDRRLAEVATFRMLQRFYLNWEESCRRRK